MAAGFPAQYLSTSHAHPLHTTMGCFSGGSKVRACGVRQRAGRATNSTCLLATPAHPLHPLQASSAALASQVQFLQSQNEQLASALNEWQSLVRQLQEEQQALAADVQAHEQANAAQVGRGGGVVRPASASASGTVDEPIPTAPLAGPPAAQHPGRAGRQVQHAGRAAVWRGGARPGGSGALGGRGQRVRAAAGGAGGGAGQPPGHAGGGGPEQAEGGWVGADGWALRVLVPARTCA